MIVVYILQSQLNGHYYIGSTSDFGRRLIEHNRGQTKSTKSGRPWECVFLIEHPNAGEVERKIKNYKSRKIVEQIIDEQSLDCLKI